MNARQSTIGIPPGRRPPGAAPGLRGPPPNHAPGLSSPAIGRGVLASTPTGRQVPATPASKRHSISNPMRGPNFNVRMQRPRGPPPSTPYGINSPSPGSRFTIQTPPATGFIQGVQRGPPPRGPPPRGPPPQGPPPRGFPVGNLPGRAMGPNFGIKGGHPSDNQPGSQAYPPKLVDIRGFQGRKMSMTNDINSPPQQAVASNSAQSPPKSGGVSRLPLNRALSNKPTDISQLGPPPSDVQSFAPSFSVTAEKPFGKLVFTIIRGKSLKAGQGVFGRANPYVKIKVGNKEMTTEPHTEGGKNPVWNKEFDVEITNEKEMEVEILNKEPVGGSKFMGRATVSILDWIALSRFDGSIEILDKSGSLAGEIIVSAQFFKPDEEPINPKTSAAGGHGSGGPKQEFSDAEILNSFHSFDLDRNNYVGAAEIRHILVNIGERVTDEEVDEMIRMVDKDGDGQVSFDEFYRMVTGGKKAPRGLGLGGRHTANAIDNPNQPVSAMSPQATTEARNAKRKLLDEFSRDHNLKPESIKRAHKRYVAIDKNNTGLIDYIEFCEILQIDPSPQCEIIFAKYDYRKTGMIDAKEVLIALANFTGAGKDDKLKFAFLLFDEDNNGVISKSELVKILKANHMAKTDTEVHRKADTIMSQADKNGDGVMSFDEFATVSKKFPNILFPSYSKR